MFGRKTHGDLTIAFNDNYDKIADNINETNPNYIFYNKDKKFEHQIEVYVRHEDNKIPVFTDSQTQMSDFLNQIVDAFRNNQDYFDLDNLQVTKLSTSEMTEIPIEGTIQDNHIKTGDVIICELLISEFWNKVLFELRSKVMKRNIKVEYKLSKRLKIYKWKLLLLRCGLDLFIDQLSKDNAVNYHFNYYLEEVMYTINTKTKFTDPLIDKDQVQKHMSSSTPITITINFGIFEEFMYNEIILLKFPENSPNIRRFNEMKDTPFYGFIEDENFQPEYRYIKNIIKDLTTTEKINKSNNILFYSRKNITHANNQNNKQNNTEEFESSSDGDFFFQESLYRQDISNNDIITSQKHMNEMFTPKMIILLVETKSTSSNPKIRNVGTKSTFRTTKHKTKTGMTPKKNPKACKSFGEIGEGNDNFFVDDGGYSEGIYIYDQKDFPSESPTVTIKRRPKREATFAQYNKLTFLENMRNCSRIINLVEDFRVKFSSENINEHILSKQKFRINEDTFKKMVIPQSRDIDVLSQGNNENEFEKNLWKVEGENIKISNQKVLIFILIVLLYFLFVFCVINLDLFNV
jgi:hypothetical protein